MKKNLRKNCAIRVEGNSSIGYGHVKRVIALIQALYKEFNIYIFSELYNDKIKSELSNYKINIYLLKSSNYIDQNRFIQKKIKNLDLVIFDGYKFNYKCQKFFYDQNIRVVSIDDEAKRKFCSNLIINHAPKISSLNYPGLNTCLGLNYLMVQDYFFNNLKKHHKKQNVFICLGASNYSTKYLIRILKILAYVPEIYKIHAIAQNNHYFFKDSEIKKIKNKINIYSNVESIKVSNLLKQSTIAICSASTVSLEACASKVPVIVGFLNNNQK